MLNPLTLQNSQKQLSQQIDDWANSNHEVSEFMRLVEAVVATIRHGGKIIFFGNGGSAAEASHLAAEFIGKCEKDVGPMAAISLTDSISSLTAISNDWSYDEVFSRQVTALAREHDLLIGLSTSGKSRNILMALATGHQMGIKTSLWTSSSFKTESNEINFVIKTPSSRTPRSQELHLFLGHLLCEYVEEEFSK